MQERYEIETLEQLRAIADMLRLRIVDLLYERPMTVTQLAERLGIAPAKVHYHVRELEKVGLLRLVETREKGGILEKYYQPVARSFEVAKELLHSSAGDEVIQTTRGWFQQFQDGFLRSIQAHAQHPTEKPMYSFGLTRLYMTHEELEKLLHTIAELARPYEVRRDIEGEHELVGSLIVYPDSAAVDTEKNEKRAEVASTMTPQTGQTVVHATPRSEWIVGTATYSVADLERVVAGGKRLRIYVVGICRFAPEVSAGLVEQAVEQFQLIGKLDASAEVNAVLRKKRRLAAE
jgi:DNA-binding transcriptional ArsR family regulator